MNFKRLINVTGWLVFAIAFAVFFLSAERSGSLWDCGEFIAGAYKLQVVHPPGAPLFLLIGRMFTIVAETVSNNPADIAFSVNLMSGMCTALAAMFVAWVTMLLGKMIFNKREEEPSMDLNLALAGAGLAAGLATAFSTSIWFSAVEGEVYAMSTFFTAMTLWATIKWYHLPDTNYNDRWLVFAVYASGLSMGVHLLSILTYPALAMFYYFKKYPKPTFWGSMVAAAAGLALIAGLQIFIITGLISLWANMELTMVNSWGLPVHSGVIPVILVVAAVLFFGLRFIHQRGLHLAQMLLVSGFLLVVSYSLVGIVVIRANAEPPINMNDPGNAWRLLPYLNREQYGERPLFYGPWYGGKVQSATYEDRYDLVNGEYKVLDEKPNYQYNPSDMMLFPRMGDNSQPQRQQLYEEIWRNPGPDGKPKKTKPTQLENISYLVRYQLGWMYWRYFMWNFAGRQNGEQGFYPGDPRSGHWYSGITFLDEARLHEESKMPEYMKKHQARNKYYMLPFLFGLIGLFFHFKRRGYDAFGLLAMFVITGIGIIIYSNQPPSEPRERDYVLVGSFFTFAIWIGMGVLAIYDLLKNNAKLSGVPAAAAGSALVLIAPLLMLTQNFDDHSRRHHSGARDYAVNFLESLEPNAIIFTYGDNDTYPLWYAQEVENVRRDVRVVNLSLIQVDWYINLLRRKVNDSPPIKLTIGEEAYRGTARVTVPYFNREQGQEAYDPEKDRITNVLEELKFIGADQVKNTSNRRQARTYFRSKRLYIEVDSATMASMGIATPQDTSQQFLARIPVRIPANKEYLVKDEIAILDVIASNINDRPIYFSVTCRPEKFFGLQDFMQLEGLGLRIIPIYTPLTDLRRQYGSVYGAGRVAADLTFERVMDKFRWGNFDKKELYVDRSFGPAVQSLHFSLLRTAEDFSLRGQYDKAVQLCEKFFEAFPNMNFPYDYKTMRFIQIMLESDAYDKAKPHMQILEKNLVENFEFFESLSPSDLEFGFSDDLNLNMRTASELLDAVKKSPDTEYAQHLESVLGKYLPQAPPPSIENLNE